MDKEKFQLVLNYFSDMGIEIPVSVRNSIEDVFMENDNVGGVECYHKEDLKVFESDMVIKNNIDITVNNGSTGEFYNVWTYYGEINYSYGEDYNLVDKDGNIIETISNIQSELDTSELINPNDWVVLLLEKLSWNKDVDTPSREATLYIYCPEESGE